MNKEEPFRDQAERLRQKIEKIKEGVEIENGLPSRTDVHRNKNNKTKWKLKFPVIRLLVLFFILLPVVIFSIYSYLGTINLSTSERVNSKKSGYEIINLQERNEFDKKNEPNLIDKEANKLKSQKEKNTTNENDPDAVKISGEKITEAELPSTDKDQTATVNESEEPTEKLVYHTVQSNETLFRIAMKYYESQEGIGIIQQANQINGNEIQVGQVLKIPK